VVSNSGSGALTISAATQVDFSLDTTYALDWIVWNGSTTPNTKNGGGSLIGKTDINGAATGYSGPVGAAISWTGGTPLASATATNASIDNVWGSVNSGWDITFPIGTVSKVCDVILNGYNQIVDVTGTLSDGSSAPVAMSTDCGAGGSMQTTRYRFTVNAASAGQTFTASFRTRSPAPYGDGNIHLRAAGIVS
jgi:hypothetical protein